MANPNIYHTYLFDQINYLSVKEVIRDINSANKKSEYKSIVFTIASGGGPLYPAYALYDHIKKSEKPIDIIATGYCSSAAVLVLQAGIKRLATKNTTFMVHPSHNKIEDNKSYDEFMVLTEAYKVSHEKFVELTIERAQISRKEFEKIYNPRRYLTPQEALKIGKYGLIDEII